MSDVTKNKTVSFPEAYDEAVKDDTTLQPKYSHMCYKAGVFTFTFDSALSGSEDTILDDILTNTSDMANNRGLWKEIVYDSNWETPSSISTLSYRCRGNTLQIEGSARRGGSNITPTGDLIGTLQKGCRPTNPHSILGLANNTPNTIIGICLIKIKANGEVNVTCGSQIETGNLVSISAVVMI